VVTRLQERGPVYGINTILDDKRRLCFVSYGDIVYSHRAAVHFVHRYAQVPVPHKFKTVVTCAAGYPLDKTYYQTIKGMASCLEMVAPGGDLIVVSEISEGFGSAEFRAAQQRLCSKGKEEFKKELAAKENADIDEWQTQMLIRALDICNVYLYAPNLSREDAAITGVRVVPSVEKCIAQSIARHGDQRIGVIPEGPYVVPSLATNVAPQSKLNLSRQEGEAPYIDKAGGPSCASTCYTLANDSFTPTLPSRQYMKMNKPVRHLGPDGPAKNSLARHTTDGNSPQSSMGYQG